MTDKVETFPQHRADQSAQKRIEAIMETPSDLRSQIEQIFDEFPKMDVSAILSIIKNWIDRNRQEAAGLEVMHTILTEKGHPLTSAIRDHFMGDEAQQLYRDVDAAVEADPYWEKTAEGHYTCKEGATYTTPEELAEAYRRNRDG